jgi:putative thioredoxin
MAYELRASADFQEAVLEKSWQKPVVVDFWAPWCGPCRVLGPVIEALAAEAGEAWELVKLNTEQHPEIAQSYQIMSIPAVKMFFRGKPIAEFVGALPRYQIEKWLGDHLPDSRLEALSLLIAQGDREALLAFAEANPGLAEARLAAARELVYEDPQAAREWVKGIQEGHALDLDAAAIRSLADLLASDAPGPEAVRAKIAAAREAALARDPEAAIGLLIEALTLDKQHDGELPRRAVLAFFRMLGENHPLTQRYRPYFSMALY